MEDSQSIDGYSIAYPLYMRMITQVNSLIALVKDGFASEF